MNQLLLSRPSLARQRIERQLQLKSHLHFVREHFQTVDGDGAEFLVGRHHPIICQTIDRVFSGEIKRLIINISPRYSKTLLGTTMLSARGFAINPAAKFMHLSYSASLVKANSNQIRDIVGQERYTRHHAVDFQREKNAAGKWVTTAGGEFYATSTLGQVTGMGAGRDGVGFQGALLIDDPIKPTDAEKAELQKVNGRYHNTIRSRVFPPKDTPIILIMQRVHDDDLSGYLLKGGSGERWHHLNLPIEILEGQDYPLEWTHGIEIKHGLSPGPLWERIHSQEDIDQLRMPEAVFAAQYMQRPLQGSGLIFLEDHFNTYTELPNLYWRAIYADTAQKAKESSDFTVFQCWGAGRDGKAYLIDNLRIKVGAPEMLIHARKFWAKHKEQDSVEMGALRSFNIEDKVSGTGLIQNLARDGIPVHAIPRGPDQNKVLRANDVVASFATGLVMHPHPARVSWVQSWKSEMLSFPDGAFDDQCDPTFDAVADIVGGNLSILDAL